MPNRRNGAARAPLPITDRDRAILYDVWRHGQMMRSQVQRLHFCHGGRVASDQVACRRLRLLTAHGYLRRWRIPVPQGSGPYVYQVAEAGWELLEAMGVAVERRRSRATTVVAVQHALEVVDFHLALDAALASAGGAIVRWLGEQETRHRFACDGRMQLFTPDGYWVWFLDGEEGAYFLEWDRATENMTRIRDKLARYQAYYRLQLYRDHLGEVVLRPRLAIVTTNHRRQRRLDAWLSRQLACSEYDALPTVLVGLRDAVACDPLGRVWHSPGRRDTVRLTD